MDSNLDFSLLTGNGIATRSAKAGEIIFKEGDEAHQLFAIKSGEVAIQLGNRTLAELPANSIFGEMALIDDAPRSATAVAKTDVELVAISERQFLFLVSQTPFFCAQGHARAGEAPKGHEQDLRLGPALVGSGRYATKNFVNLSYMMSGMSSAM
jgi:CRP/FNR family cyclic AMP-dependent transcriptional regulator